MNQPVLLELEAPIKICGARRTSLRSRATGRSALLAPCWRHTLLPVAYLWSSLPLLAALRRRPARAVLRPAAPV